MKTYNLRYETIDSEREQEVSFEAICDGHAKNIAARYIERGLLSWCELTDENGTLIEE